MIAEDLGVITPAVQRLRDSLGLPGHGDPAVGVRPGPATASTACANHAEHRIAYTGTHDNDTVRGWYESLDGRRGREVDSALARRRPGGRRRAGGA